MALPKHLTDFFEGRPALKVIKRSDQEFDATKQVFIESPDVPLVIVRPQTAEQVAELVGHLSANSTPLVIRAGGHDLSTRSVAQDAVQIDLRDLNTVQVAEDKRTARIGGGILTQGLLDGLAAEGVMTACGNAGTVGWCSWAMNGGYGIMVAKYGLGCDQIVGARVVLADGRIVVADERLLKALRGAGPAFGVIVELEIKVYPLTEVRAIIVLRRDGKG
jgi:FAD/FMN-containing dehydrogenase